MFDNRNPPPADERFHLCPWLRGAPEHSELSADSQTKSHSLLKAAALHVEERLLPLE